MNNLPLQPLVWFETEYSVGLIPNIGAQGAGIFYRIAKVGDKTAVTWHDQSEGSTGAKELGSVCEAKNWIATDHYPSKMQPYVKPSPTWIDVNERLPEEDGLYLALRKGFTFEMGNASDLVPQVSGWNGGRGCFDDDHGNVLITHWMPIPEFSTMQNSKGE